MKLRLTLAVALGLPLLVLAAGCGDDTGLAKRYSVSGKVTYKGQPVANGLISFIPGSAEGRAATGQIKDGNYSLTTQDPDDGAFPGSYTVTVAARQVDFTEAKGEAEKKGATSAYIPQDFTAKANQKAKNAVPEKYGIQSSTPLKAEVKASSNKIDFELVD